MSQTFENATIYVRSELGMGYICKKVKWVKVEIKKYAQYPSAVHVEFLEKGKRKPCGFVQSYKPSLVIAAGHNNPSAPDIYNPISDDGVVKVSRAKFSSCSDGWQQEFESVLLPHLEVLANFHGHNSLAV